MAKNRTQWKKKDLGRVPSGSTPFAVKPAEDDDITFIAAYPTESAALSSPSSSSSLSIDETSTYFSHKSPGLTSKELSELPTPKLGDMAETPGPGYSTFSEHVMDVDGASTPVSRSQPDFLPPGPGASLRRLEFGLNELKQSPMSPVPMADPRKRKRLRGSPAVVDPLRINPGESERLVKTILTLQPQRALSQPKTPQNSINETDYVLTPIFPATSPPTFSQPARIMATKRARSVIPLTYPLTEEVMIDPPEGSTGEGMKQIKLKEDFTTSEFVDFMLDDKTFSWDIVKDATTGKMRSVFHQKLE